MDRQGFGKPLAVATVSIPAGWKSEGGVVRSQNYQLDDGTYVQTNDQFYDPYADTGQGATELEVTE